MCFHGIEHEFGEIVNRLIMNVMFDEEEVIWGRVYAFGADGIYIFRLLDIHRIVIQVTRGVQVKVSNMVAHALEAV